MAQVISSIVLQNHLCTVCMYMAMGEKFMAIYGSRAINTEKTQKMAFLFTQFNFEMTFKSSFNKISDYFLLCCLIHMFKFFM